MNEQVDRFPLGLGFKIAIMATLLVLAATVIIGWQFYLSSKSLLVEHELTDLQDESQLKGKKFLEHIRKLREDVLYLASLTEMQAFLRTQGERNQEDPLTDQSSEELESRLKVILQNVGEDRSDYAQIRLVKNASAQEAPIDIFRLTFQDPNEKETSNQDSNENEKSEEQPRLVDIEEQVADEQALHISEMFGSIHQKEHAENEAPVYLSDVEWILDPTRKQDPAAASTRIRMLHAAVPLFPSGADQKKESPWGYICISMNFEKPLKSELTRSPRHIVILSDEEQRMLVDPNPKSPGNDQLVDRSKSFKVSELDIFQGSDIQKELEDCFTKDENKKDYFSGTGKRLGELPYPLRFEEGGYQLLVVLPRVQADGKVPEEQSKKWSKLLLTENLQEEPSEQEVLWDPFFQTNLRLTSEMRNPIIRFRSGQPDRIQKIKADILREVGAKEVESFDLIDCETFAMHFYRLYYDPLHKDRYWGMFIAVSYQEIESGFAEEAKKIWFWVFLLVLIATVLAILFTKLMTKPLKDMTRMTRRLAEGDTKASLASKTLNRHDEIGRLARSFQQMVYQIREREETIQEREGRIRAIVNTAAEGIMTITDEGEITSFNEAASRIFGYSLPEVAGEHFTMLYPPHFGEVFNAYLKEYLKTGTARMIGRTTEAIALRKNGEQFPLELAMSEVARGDRKLFTSIFRDITERKEAEQEIRSLNQELQELNADLDQRVKRRTEELEIVTEKAVAASRTKDKFLANMSHELRTPLNAIIGYSEMLIEDAKEEGHTELGTDLGRIHDAGQHLLTLINEILDLAKIEAGKMNLDLEEFQIDLLCHTVIETLQIAAGKNQNQLTINAPNELGTMIADQMKLRQVLMNLLSNSCKFTEEGTVHLDVSRIQDPAKGEIIQFAVHDTGIGMSPEQLERLFQAFTQADDTTSRKYGGSGLGLVISQRFAQLMGGDIQVESELGVGSTFTVWLPAEVKQKGSSLRQMTSSERSKLTSRSEEKAKLRQRSNTREALQEIATKNEDVVLVIDDDPTVCELMQRFLGKEGLQVLTASSGREGIEMAQKRQPTVITLDVAMPEMNGWEVLRELKDNSATKNIPVIMVTMVDDRSRGFALGATEYVNKPIDWEQLVLMLKQMMIERDTASILVVDDDMQLRKSLRSILEQEGWTVYEASHGEQALKLLTEHFPNLILLDSLMPGMDGLQFLNKLHSRMDLKHIPVVMMTGMAPLIQYSPEERKQLKSQVEQVLLKGSFNQEELLREVYDRVQLYATQRNPDLQEE